MPNKNKICNDEDCYKENKGTTRLLTMFNRLSEKSKKKVLSVSVMLLRSEHYKKLELLKKSSDHEN